MANIKYVYMQKIDYGPSFIHKTQHRQKSAQEFLLLFSICFSCNFGLYHLEDKEIKYVKLIYESY